MVKKSQDNEKLDDNNIARVIELLEAEKPITKKHACELLAISYNTTRLNTIIEKYKDKKTREKKYREEKRGKPATKDEIRYAVKSYLEGDTIDSISKSLYRSTLFVRSILESHGVPIRNRSYDYFKPAMVPELSMKDRFKVGEKCYSMRYDTLCVVEDEVPHYLERVYRVWLLSDRWQQYAYQPASELCSLEHLEKEGLL